MADLISRAVLLKKLDVTMRITAPDDYRLRIPEAIEKLPAVDAVPVVHAYWNHCNGKSHIWYCSNCGEKCHWARYRMGVRA